MILPKKILTLLVGISLGVVVFLLLQKGNMEKSLPSRPATTPGTSESSSSQDNKDFPRTEIIAENLDTPWALAFLPDQSILVTERLGKIYLIEKNDGIKNIEFSLQNGVKEIGEGGLMGIAAHPDFSSNNSVYIYYTYSGEGNNTLNRVSRLRFDGARLTDEKIIVDRIPGAANHNGGRIKFGPDELLYITTGDSQDPSLSQDSNSFAGKILRVDSEGNSPRGNPFNGSGGTPGTRSNLTYSFGHRNPQGIAWDGDGNLWSTEHGRSAPTGLDEINLIESGKNYGWDIIQGDETRSGMVTPVLNSGPNTTWAPAGAAFVGDSLFFAGLRGQTLYEAVIKNNQVAELKEHFKGEFGRLREVVLGPEGMLYVTTSNRDGRGSPKEKDDKIIKINIEKL